MTLLDPLTLLLVALAYMLGNVVKGVSGFGAILIAVPLMSMLVEPAVAIALTGAPVVTSNIWQLWDSGQFRWAFHHFWKLIAVMIPTSLMGAQFLAVVDPRISGAVIGAMVLLFCFSMLFPVRLEIPTAKRKYIDPLVGGIVGLFGGASMLTGALLIIFLVALNLRKNQFVGAIALIYLVNSIPIYATLSYFDRYTMQTIAVSIGLIAPAILGLVLGRRIRDRISQLLFRRIVVGLLFAIGFLLIQRAWTIF